MPTLIDKRFDLVLTDPPYGINICGNSKPVGIAADKSRKATNETWDNLPPPKIAFEEMFRLSANQIIFGGNYFLEYLFNSQCYIVWDKRGNLPSVPFADTEWAWTSFNKMSKKYTVINHGFIKDSKETICHPTQKPLLLITMIVLDFTALTDIIFDPFLGSGTTLVAAQNEGRQGVGIESKEDYCKIAVERLRQPSFFSLPESKPNGNQKSTQMKLEGIDNA